jgi:hypothetical protein
VMAVLSILLSSVRLIVVGSASCVGVDRRSRTVLCAYAPFVGLGCSPYWLLCFILLPYNGQVVPGRPQTLYFLNTKCVRHDLEKIWSK